MTLQRSLRLTLLLALSLAPTLALALDPHQVVAKQTRPLSLTPSPEPDQVAAKQKRADEQEWRARREAWQMQGGLMRQLVRHTAPQHPSAAP